MIKLSPVERLKARGYCVQPELAIPPPGAIGLDLCANCPCGRRVKVTAGGRYSHHKPATVTASR